MLSTFPPELDQFVQQELASGKYRSEEDVICEGLRLLREREGRLQALREDIKPALDQLDRGEGRPLDAESIKSRGRQRLAVRKSASQDEGRLMPKVIRASLAELDLDEIWDYIAEDNISAANRLIDTIVARCEMLAIHTELGERRPELASRLRSFVVGNYVIFYRPMQGGIEVARVIHGARDVNALF